MSTSLVLDCDARAPHAKSPLVAAVATGAG